MNTKSVFIGIAAIIIIALIGYFIYSNAMKPDEEATQNEGQQTQTTATTTPLVQGQDVQVGTGKEATPNSQVTVEYVGKLPDGTVFDQGTLPPFVLGAPGIIPGFQIGVRGMKEGGERIIAVPPELGYGAEQFGPIPPNSTLIFELKLIKVEEVPAAPTE